jgi:Tol biopolymer transport system component
MKTTGFRHAGASCGAALLLVAAACRNTEVTSPSTEGLRGTPATIANSVDLLTLTGRIAFVRNGQIYVMNANGTGVTRLTNSTALNEAPTWSPDGSRIAFVRSITVSPEIFVMNANGTGVTRLTHNSAIERAPDWSPDGSKIAFVSDRADHDEIYVMKADGSGVTRLTTKLPFQGCGGTSHGSEEAPAWSPDGSKIAFLHKTTCFSNDIDVMKANGTGVTRLTNAGLAGSLAWGRTGKIAFDPRVTPGVGFSDGEIAVVTVNGATVTRLTSNTANDLFPAWSPDGTKIAFESDRAGNFEIYAMNANGTGVTRLTHNLAFDGEPAWGH